VHVPGLAETLVLRVGLWIARGVAGARGRDMTGLWREVQSARAEGIVLLARIKGADDNERTRRWLTRAVIDWYGPFEITLAEQAPELFEEFRSPGIPVGTVEFEDDVPVNREETPVDLTVLRRVVRDDLRRLRRIHRRLVWPGLKLGIRRRS
jgi:hypothetical protein